MLSERGKVLMSLGKRKSTSWANVTGQICQGNIPPEKEDMVDEEECVCVGGADPLAPCILPNSLYVESCTINCSNPVKRTILASKMNTLAFVCVLPAE